MTWTVFFFFAAAVSLTDAGRLICGANTWQPSWASSPDAACALWAGSTSWGALKNGQTLEEGCRTSTFAQQDCSLTCCDYRGCASYL